MAKLGTICNECVFYGNEDKSCTLGKIDKFLSAGAEVIWDESGPSIDRVCMYRRPFTWSSGKNLPECISQVKEEVHITGTILLLVENLADLERNLRSLRSIDGIDSFRLIINHTDKISREEMGRFSSELDFDDYFCVLSFEEDLSKRLFECFGKSKNGLFIVLDCSKDLDTLFVDKLEYFINQEMIRMVHVKPVDGFHMSVTPAIIYKQLYGDLEGSVAEKIVESDGEKMIFSWEDVNEKYQNKL